MLKESLRHAYHVSLPCRIGCFGTLGACRVLKSGGPFLYILYVPWNLGPKQCWTPKLHKFQPFVPHWCVAFCGSKTSIETRISISSMSATPLFVRTAPAERPTHPKDVDDNNVSRQAPFWWCVVSLACRIRVLDVGSANAVSSRKALRMSFHLTLTGQDRFQAYMNVNWEVFSRHSVMLHFIL